MLKVLPDGGAVRFRDVGFAYHAAGDPALERIDIDIPAGKKIALVGPSGGGKSTLFNLLLRFYDPDFGAIAIDGQDIHGVSLESLRGAIGTPETSLHPFVPQRQRSLSIARSEVGIAPSPADPPPRAST